jgi:hypothetical protein
MISVSNSQHGTLTIEAPQSQIDNFLNHARSAGIHVRQSVANKPKPLPVPEMDFEPVEGKRRREDDRIMVLNLPPRSDDKPETLGIPTMDFPPLTKAVE